MKRIYRVYRVLQDRSTGAEQSTYTLQIANGLEGYRLPEFSSEDEAEAALTELLQAGAPGPYTIIEEFSR